MAGNLKNKYLLLFKRRLLWITFYFVAKLAYCQILWKIRERKRTRLWRNYATEHIQHCHNMTMTVCNRVKITNHRSLLKYLWQKLHLLEYQFMLPIMMRVCITLTWYLYVCVISKVVVEMECRHRTGLLHIVYHT